MIGQSCPACGIGTLEATELRKIYKCSSSLCNKIVNEFADEAILLLDLYGKNKDLLTEDQLKALSEGRSILESATIEMWGIDEENGGYVRTNITDYDGNHIFIDMEWGIDKEYSQTSQFYFKKGENIIRPGKIHGQGYEGSFLGRVNTLKP
jgi:hypothetical protein